MTWRTLFRQHLASARVSVFDELLHNENDLAIDHNSRVLISNVDTAEALLQWYIGSNQEAPLPRIIIAQELAETTTLDLNHKQLQCRAQVRSLQNLDSWDFTHAILHIHTDRSDGDVLRLLQQVYNLLSANGKLVLSRRKRDGLAETLYKAGVQVPGRSNDANTMTTNDQEDRLEALATEAGFYPSNINRIEKAYSISNDASRLSLDYFKTALRSDLGPCDEDAGWMAKFNHAVETETKNCGEVKLVASVVIAVK